ncbi:MAG: HNH endonuclease, partial [Erysipelotrichaceae bacterium]
MKIGMMKKVLTIIDREEIKGLNVQPMLDATYDALIVEFPNYHRQQLEHFFQSLFEVNVLKQTPNGLDLSPAATILARSLLNSDSEALAFFEIICHNSNHLHPLKAYLRTNEAKDHRFFETYLGSYEFFQFALQSSLFQKHGHQYFINPRLIPDCKRIVGEYLHHPPLLSDTLKAIFTKEVISFQHHHSFRNQERSMIDYYNKHSILNILPYLGIPESRDDTKILQSFYKDTLFHEFDHCCAICGINLAQMLIASHIKPFRDCGHLFEAIDNNNGLLLCRNHDYLFDQGYITFDEQGVLILSEPLKRISNYERKFVLQPNFVLPADLLRRS